MNEFLSLTLIMTYFASCYTRVQLPGSRATPPASLSSLNPHVSGDYPAAIR
jgi:hypothetical protein